LDAVANVGSIRKSRVVDFFIMVIITTIMQHQEARKESVNALVIVLSTLEAPAIGFGFVVLSPFSFR
jgi:hypothetical protein